MTPCQKRKELIKRIAEAINSVSRENESNTPDYILAEMLVDHLEAFEYASLKREEWYGKSLSIGGSQTSDVVKGS